MNGSLQDALLSLIRADDETAWELDGAGVLADGYHPRMEAVHRRNAARLRELIARHGWPGIALAGADGAAAARRIVQHAIGEPEFMRQCLALLQDAVARGEAPAWQAAMLEDRIRILEGRRQFYGTQLEADEAGAARPCPVEDPAGRDGRRRAVGLDPLEQAPSRAGRIARPSHPDRHAREREAWLVRTGWRR